IVIQEMEQQMADLEAEFEAVMQKTDERWAQIAAQTQEYTIAPFKKDITLELFGLGWSPYWVLVVNGQAALLPAFA
ncbi:MAG: hypothetical protein H7Y11_02545, partial [Armatimonadetes bacterium]|nr:hypothetical protein [Anaerolineae bacterium]